MIILDGQPILTAAAMREAEDASGADTDALMMRAGAAIAVAVRRLAGPNPVLILCGPGNNGGDGYVAARLLKEAGIAVRIAATGDPGSDAARHARAAWDGVVEALADTIPAPVLVDALFGTGLARPLDPALAACLRTLADAASLTIAIDVPSGVATDSGAVLTQPPVFAITLALGAAKPAHVLQPAARYCGIVRVLDIDIPVDSSATVLAPPDFATPGPDSHKYSRGMVAIVAGSMAGASELASIAGMRAGAGYVVLLGDTAGPPHALVRKPLTEAALADPRIGAIAIGPGLGRDDIAKTKVQMALSAGRPIVVDGDALHLTDPAMLAAHPAPMILTPHAGEFDALFGASGNDKISRARAAAKAADAIVVFKGADTVIAAPDGRVCVAPDASDWLSTAGTGDVLAGAVAAMLASGMDAFAAARAGVWLHGDGARRLGGAFIADDLADALTVVRGAL